MDLVNTLFTMAFTLLTVVVSTITLQYKLRRPIASQVLVKSVMESCIHSITDCMNWLTEVILSNPSPNSWLRMRVALGTQAAICIHLKNLTSQIKLDEQSRKLQNLARAMQHISAGEE